MFPLALGRLRGLSVGYRRSIAGMAGGKANGERPGGRSPCPVHLASRSEALGLRRGEIIIDVACCRAAAAEHLDDDEGDDRQEHYSATRDEG